MFFYLSAAIFIFGAEINGAWRRDVAARLRAQRAAQEERRRAKHALRGAAQAPGQGATTAG
jgi:uncharacterized BrkB/YihY/UPF0761 family membrane protein